MPLGYGPSQGIITIIDEFDQAMLIVFFPRIIPYHRKIVEMFKSGAAGYA